MDFGNTVGKITLNVDKVRVQSGTVALYHVGLALIGVQVVPNDKGVIWAVQIKMPETMEPKYFTHFIVEQARENGLKINELDPEKLRVINGGFCRAIGRITYQS
ncbi:hypothetical protein [Lapidilactobacillus bayanensis]|uniref:hypothetical protein n=1 Tax=Lapidilactobacillus bayanensis TaxID=2485998 RepID=UPI000F7B5D2F|nr:hypothetical protein [Lapidilactobacillus bayanensis]